MRTLRSIACVAALVAATVASAQAPAPRSPVTAIRAGRLLDPETGTVATNQVILVQDGKFIAIGANVAIDRKSTRLNSSH